MSTAEVPKFISVDDYLRAEEMATIKHEYVDGWVRAMTGASNRRNRVKLNAIMHLAVALKGRPCFPCDSDTKVCMRRHGSTKFYYPDALVVCEGNAPTDLFQDKPVVIIEVLSPSSRATDLDEKLTAYLSIETLDFYLILLNRINSCGSDSGFGIEHCEFAYVNLMKGEKRVRSL